MIGTVILLAAVLGNSAELPDRSITPGAVRKIGMAEVCAKDFPHETHISAMARRRVFRDYQIPDEDQDDYIIDHLVPIAIGGSRAIENLWPMHTEQWARKQQLELRLAAEVCNGQITLRDAQDAIRDDWSEAYVRFFGKP